MSADNGVYVLPTRGQKVTEHRIEYRIGYCHAVENLFQSPTKYVRKIFDASPVMFNLEHAMMYAEGLADQYWDLEYGIVLVRGLEHYTYNELCTGKFDYEDKD